MIRAYQDDDLEATAMVFTAAVHEGAADHYDAVQREAWVPRPLDREHWRKRLAPLEKRVAEIDATVVGFLTFERNGHIDHLFVSPERTRQGIASALLRSAEAELASAGVQHFFTEASLVARPFFERHGYVVTQEQTVDRNGVSLRRFAMEKQAHDQKGSP